MKLTITILFLCCSVLAETVFLAWDYPTNELSTNLTFILWSSTDINKPLTNWTPIRTVVGTNLTCSATNIYGFTFFSMTASNEVGQSEYSNVVGGKWKPRQPKVRLLY